MATRETGNRRKVANTASTRKQATEKQEIEPGERVRRTAAGGSGASRAEAASRRKAVTQKKAAGEETRAQEKTVTPEERVSRGAAEEGAEAARKSATLRKGRPRNPDEVRDKEEVDVERERPRQPTDDASMRGLPGFGGKMP